MSKPTKLQRFVQIKMFTFWHDSFDIRFITSQLVTRYYLTHRQFNTYAYTKDIMVSNYLKIHYQQLEQCSLNNAFFFRLHQAPMEFLITTHVLPTKYISIIPSTTTQAEKSNQQIPPTNGCDWLNDLMQMNQPFNTLKRRLKVDVRLKLAAWTT